jgi:hypothetical protein
MRVRYAIPLSIVATMVVAVCFALRPSTAADDETQDAPRAVKWEYKTLRDAGAALAEINIGELGNRGWELAGAVSRIRSHAVGGGGTEITTDVTLIFKRLKQ